jgi:hypothetical protein
VTAIASKGKPRAVEWVCRENPFRGGDKFVGFFRVGKERCQSLFEQMLSDDATPRTVHAAKERPAHAFE